jgi:hypothetical protein
VWSGPAEAVYACRGPVDCPGEVSFCRADMRCWSTPDAGVDAAMGIDAYVSPATDAYVAPGTDAFVSPGTDRQIRTPTSFLRPTRTFLPRTMRDLSGTPAARVVADPS